MRNECGTIAAVVFFASGPTVLGHALLVSRADAIVSADRVTIQIDVNCDDFLHWHILAPSREGLVAKESMAAAAIRHESFLEGAFIVRDSAGNRLRSDGWRAQADWLTSHATAPVNPRDLQVRYVSSFVLAERPSLIAFQLLSRDASASTPWQVALRVRADSDTTTIPLTSRANVEIVELLWKEDQPSLAMAHREATACPMCGDRGPDRFREACADFELGNDGVEAYVLMPLPLLFTFRGLSQSIGDFLSTEEQRNALDAGQQLLRGALQVEADGRLLTPDVISLTMVPPTRRNATGEPERISFWLGSLSAHIRFAAHQDYDRAALRWALFNNAVLTGVASIRCETGCVEHEFSTYDPEYLWVKH
jgi:hypothetical protein